MSDLLLALTAWADGVRQLPLAYPEAFAWLTLLTRILFPVLALGMMVQVIRSLVRAAPRPEVWARLSLPNGAVQPLTHWENILGRADSCDLVLNYPVVSRQHAALIRAEDDSWTVHDLGSKSGTAVNGVPVPPQGAPVAMGDVLSLGGVETVLLPLPEDQTPRTPKGDVKPVSPWGSLILLTLFQLLAAAQFLLFGQEESALRCAACLLALTGVMWFYCAAMRCAGRVGFEMETVAFFLSTLSLSVTASSSPASVPKQLAAILLGVLLLLVLGGFLRDLDRVRKIRWLMAAGAVALLSLSVLAGTVKYGASNWISLFGISFQPSELAKLCYIFAGAATLDRLFRKRNLGLFILLTGLCIGCLALMSDFGTAAIFFVTFLVIAYLRSGDFTTLALICAGAVFGALTLVSIKPYILRRFAAWGHVWEQASGAGYQQTRTMSAAASGGLIGVGPGEGWLHNVAAADTDLVFGMVCEEWGLIIAVLAVLCVVALAVFSVRCCRAGRSSFYAIAACAASSLMVFQLTLNVLGSVDILPLTGVTFPFVSNGGSSMLASWGILAFLKAADTRTNASFAAPAPKLQRPQWSRQSASRKEEQNEEN